MALIYLCGITGVGKSTIGSELSTILGYECVDIDDRIVQEAEMSIADIFADEGEKGFRLREARTITTTLQYKNCVVALGGGALKTPSVLTDILLHGTLIYLRTSAAVIAERVFGDVTRPMLAGPETVEELEAVLSVLIKSRAEMYEQAHVLFEIDPDISAHENAKFLHRQLMSAGIV